MQAKFRAFIRHPFVIVVPLILAMMFGWHQYIQVSRGLNESRHNILAGGSFDRFDSQGVPVDWTMERNGSLDYKLGIAPGYVGRQALTIQTSNYQNGDLLLSSTKTNVQPDKTYLFKGYYSTKGTFELLARMYYKDGTSRLNLLHTYESTDAWSTVGDAFQAESNVQAVQFVYRFSADMTVSLDGTYLEAKSGGVYLPPHTAMPPNLIPNADLAQADKNMPKGWNAIHLGSNKTEAAYVRGAASNPYVRVTVSDYKEGEAKWQYAPQPTSPGQAYQFGVDYTSDVPSEIVAEYTLKDGSRQFEQLASLRPASTWTHVEEQFETPANAASVFVSIVLRQNGTVGTDNYELHDITKKGARYFTRPLVSFTFDDGWESAYTNGAQLLNAQHLQGTFYLNPSTIGTANFMSSKQVKALQKEGQHVTSHGYEHLDMTAISAHRLSREFKTARDYFTRELGISTPIDYASPYGRSDPEVQAYVRQYYRSQRGTESGVNTRQNLDPYNLRVFYVSSDTKLSALQQALDEAKAEQGWLILVYHRVEHKPGDQTAVEPNSFSQQVNLVQSAHVPVVSVKSALDELLPKR